MRLTGARGGAPVPPPGPRSLELVLQGIQEREQLLLLCRTQLVELSGYVLRLTPMAIDRLLER